MKRQKGITLIALVITIIVLLILATVSITADKLTIVYNIDVIDNNNYYVGESSVLAHNLDSPTAVNSCSSGIASPEEGMISPDKNIIIK